MKIYPPIVDAVKSGKLKEPFNSNQLKIACKGKDIKESVVGSYATRHRKGNPGKRTEYFEKVAQGKFKLIRPFKHGL